jgi:hypothetical protein
MKFQEQESPPLTWFVRHEGLVTGPHSEAQLRQQLLEGVLTQVDEISLDKNAWQSIMRVPNVIPVQMRAEAGDQDAVQTMAFRKRLSSKDRERRRRIPFVPLFMVLLLVGIALTISLMTGLSERLENDDPQCDRPPAPGVNWRNCLLPNLDVGPASLRGANLNSSVLRYAKLSTTILNQADLSYADLRYADLRYAQLRHAQLMGANMQKTDLRDADLSQADLRFADLTGSQIDGILLKGARLDNAIWWDGSSCGPNSVGGCRIGK